MVHQGIVQGAGPDRVGAKVRTAPGQVEPSELLKELTPLQLVSRKGGDEAERRHRLGPLRICSTVT